MKKIVLLFTVFLSFFIVLSEAALAEPMVYITKYGEKYHNRNCRTLARSKYVYEISVSDALSRGYLPCKVCRPVRSVRNNVSELTKGKMYKAFCTRVIDGDTIAVRSKGNTEEIIRLYGIDCPESGQLFGTNAKKAAADLVLNKEISVQAVETDKYGRTVALVFGDEISLQKELLQNGMTWVYPKYCKAVLCEEFYALEQKARSEKIGLWKYQSTAPWLWRNM